MDRYWLLTWTTCGSWLPGDARGFVSNVADGYGHAIRRNVPGTKYAADLPALNRHARSRMSGTTIALTRSQAAVVLAELRRSAAYRQWFLAAAAVIYNHVHVVLGIAGDPEPSVLLRDSKAYASRALNGGWPRPVNGSWWSVSGSKRRLPDEPAVRAAIRYVRKQPGALAVFAVTE